MTGREYSTQQDIKKAAPRLKAWGLPVSGVPGVVLKIAASGSKTWVIRTPPPGAAETTKSWAATPAWPSRWRAHKR